MLSKRKLIIAYALLVGVPLLGLVGILEAGRKLRAPVSVEGVWEFDADLTRLTTVPCAAALTTLRHPVLVISQLGKELVGSLNNLPGARASGTIEGTRLMLAASGPFPSASEKGCTEELPFSLTATVDPTAQPRSLSGVLSLKGCPSCAPIDFRAFRQNPSAGKRNP